MSLDIEKSLFDVRDFLEDGALATQIAAVNQEATDGITVKEPLDYVIDKFDVTTGPRYPRANLYIAERLIEELAIGWDEFDEKLMIIVGEKTDKGENALLKCTRIAEAIRRAILKDATAGDAVEEIRVTGIKSYPPFNDLAICEITCSIKRQVTRVVTA